jgi:hypothetical protein
MRTHRRLVLAMLAAACVPPAIAQHRHDHKPKHGGLVKETDGLVYELVAKSSEIAVWVSDENNKAVGTQGSTAKVTLVDSGTRIEVPLAPAGGNKLAAAGAFPVKPGMAVLLEVFIGTKAIGKLRYTLK